MNPRPLLSFASIALLAALPLPASNLLSGNAARTGSASYPGTTSKAPATGRIETGATYTYLTGETANTGIGNTDPDILKMDSGSSRLVDGYNERVGNTAIYSAWQGRHGATIVFDLKQPHNVNRVSVSVREDANRGAATFQAFVSTDGVTYAPLGTWDGAKTPLDATEADPGRNTEITIAPPAPAAARYVKIFLSHWDTTHTSRHYRQLVIGEIAIWGDPR
ncbi:MAG TPA: discoidin domain-containing protein [Rariglobus sp.]